MAPTTSFLILILVALQTQLPAEARATFVLHTDANAEVHGCPSIGLSRTTKAWNTLTGPAGTGPNGIPTPPAATTTTEAADPTTDAAISFSSTCRHLVDPVVLTADCGMITSPGFMAGQSYPNDLSCGWLIRTTPGSTIHLEFNALIIEPNLICGSCGYDEVIIYDGSSMNPTPLGGPYCGDQVPAAMESSGNEVLVVFSSDHSVARAGFQLHYRTVTPDVTSSAPEATTAEPESDWCRVLSPVALDPPDQAYSYLVRFRNINSIRGANYGMPGVAFNVVDENNFDFFLMRFQNAICEPVNALCTDRCIQYGYIEDGVVHMEVAHQAACPYTTHKAGFEYRLTLTVESTAAATFAVNTYEYLTVAPHFGTMAKVGVVIPSGLSNEIYYRSAQVLPL